MSSQQTVIDEPILSNEFGNQFLYSINGDTFANQSAQQHYSQLLSENFWKEDSYHVVAGTDSGLLIEHIVNEGIPKNSVYLFVECPEYIELIRPELNEEWQQVLKFCTPDEWEQGFDHNIAAAYFYNDAVMLHYSSAIRIGRSDLYHQLRLRLDFIYKNKVYENSAGLGNREFIECQLSNVVNNINSSQLLKGAFEGKSCIILGGGPSLDIHLPWVIENQGNLLVIAVSRISRRLQEVGLIPDIVIALDPQQISFDVSKELYNFPPEVLLLNSYHVIPKLVSQWRGKSAYFGERVPWLSELNAPKHFHEGPTVVNAALITAVELGCNKIYLTGADMCYGIDGATHAHGSFESNREIEYGRDSIWLETYAGHQAETIVPLVLTANYLSKHAKYAKDNHVEVFNLSQNALRVEHVEFLDHKNIEFTGESFSAKEIIAELIPDISSNRCRQEINSVELELDKVGRDITAIASLAKDAILATEQAYLTSGSEHLIQLKRQKIEKIESKINLRYGYISNLLKTLAFKDFAKILIGQPAESLNDEELAKRNITYYQAYINGVAELKSILIPARKRLSVIKNLYSKKVDVKQVDRYLSQQKELGICNAILARRDEELPVDIRNKLAELASKNNNYVQWIDEGHARFNHGLTGLDSKIRTLFRDKNKQALTTLIEFLESSREDEVKVHDFICLARAFLAILRNNSEEAIDFFSSIKEFTLSKWDREQYVDALVLSEKYEKAMSLIATLVDHNMGLNRLYGQLLAHHKHFEQAVEAYSKYLEVFKQDIDGWAELGNVFIELAIFESALMAYDFVLSLDPNHQVAQEMTQKLRQHLGDKITD